MISRRDPLKVKDNSISSSKNFITMKNLVFTAMALLLSALGFAQTANQLSIGPRLGVNIANASNITENQSLVGLAGGLTSMYGLNDNSAISVDLLYSGEGFAHEFSDSKVRLTFLVIPIYFNYFFGDPGSVLRPKVFAGIAPGIPLSAKEDGDEDVSDVFGVVNFSFSAGGGVNYQLNDRTALTGDLRAFLGLNDLRNEDFQGGTDKVAGSNIQISFGVLYNLTTN
jgi:hypothetical protein